MSSSNKNLTIDFHEIITSPTWKDTKGLTSSFYKGYQDYYDILKDVEKTPYLDQNFTQLTDDDDRFYWLENAIEINSNNAVKNPHDPGGLSNTYIRSVTRSGLLYDGQATASDVDQKVQTNSDTIGKYVLGSLYGFAGGVIPSGSYDYTKVGRVPGIDDFVKDDIRSALEKGGQTEATWGGSFYYWNVSLDRGTVGQIIQSNPQYYEEFLAINAKAAADAGSSPGSSSWIQLKTAYWAQAPLSVESDIYARMLYGETTGNWNGDPDKVDDYTASFDDKGNFTGWQTFTEGGVAQFGHVPSADAIRDIRLSAPTDWFGGVPAHDRARTLASTPSPGTDVPQVLDPVGVDEDGSVTIAVPAGSGGGPSTVVASGDRALGGTASAGIASGGAYAARGDESDVTMADGVTLHAGATGTTSRWDRAA